MTVALEYGLRGGVMVHVNDVDRGLGCGCVCPECGARLEAKQGEVNAYHFAHYGIADLGNRLANNCGGGRESAAHLLAKQIIDTHRRLRFPNGEIQQIDEVTVEARIAVIRPDIQVVVGGERFLVEIYVTNRCSDSKKLLLCRERLPSFEINLSEWRHRRLDDGFEDAVVRRAGRVWLYDPARPALADLLLAAAAEREEAALVKLQAAKLPWVRDDYEKRRCAHPGCETFPHFGFGPPLTQTPRWTCREHREWIEQTIKQEASNARAT